MSALLRQVITSDGSSSVASQNITVGTSGIPTGTHVVVLLATSGGRTLTSISDSKSNTWTIHVTVANGSTSGVAVASAPITNALVSGDTITVTPSAACFMAAQAQVWTGITGFRTASSGVANASGTAHNGGATAATVAEGDVVMGVYATSSNWDIATPTDSYHLGLKNSSTGTVRAPTWEYKRKRGSTSAETSSVTMAGTTTSAAATVAFIAAATSTESGLRHARSWCPVTTGTGATSHVFTLPAGTAFGTDETVFFCSSETGGRQATSVTDSKGNAWTRDVWWDDQFTSSSSQTIWRCQPTSALAAGDTVTVNYNGLSATHGATFHSFYGVKASSPFDKTVDGDVYGSGGSSATPGFGTLTPAEAGELHLAVVGSGSVWDYKWDTDPTAWFLLPRATSTGRHISVMAKVNAGTTAQAPTGTAYVGRNNTHTFQAAWKAEPAPVGNPVKAII